VSAVVLGALLDELGQSAPGIDIGVQQLLPIPGEQSIERAWQLAFDELETRALDIAIVPAPSVPARFVDRILYDEDFVIAMRAGHPFADDPTLERYCRVHHLVVSLGGATQGFVDEALTKLGRSRRIVLAVPNFSLALALVANTDLVAALPRRFAATQAARVGVVIREPPLPLRRFRVRAVAPKAATLDTGLAWLLEAVVRSARSRDGNATTVARGSPVQPTPRQRRRRTRHPGHK
jgi:DNA-binding transcriptional LysR family regulator